MMLRRLWKVLVCPEKLHRYGSGGRHVRGPLANPGLPGKQLRNWHV